MSVLDIINGKDEKDKKFVIPFKVLPLNDSQENALKEVEKNILTTIIGAAGTGKTSVITTIASHFLMTKRKVLIVSKSDHAVDVICNKINNLGAGFVSFRGGKSGSMKLLNEKIMDLLKLQNDYTQVKKVDYIKYIFKKDEKIARKILRDVRKEQINNLLSNSDARKELMILAQSCNEKKKSRKDKIIELIDYNYILQAIPCWCITTAEISNVLPLKEEMFDLVICDESSEVDIASFLPCAYRAKKACVVGDDKQLKSLNFLDDKKNKSFIAKNDIPANLELIWNYRKNSLFDFCQYYTQKCILLNEQYRMPENIFKFNNEQFYNGQIKSSKKAVDGAITKILVDGETDKNKTFNKKECDVIIKDLKKWLKANKDNNKSIAILSMFTAQVDLITKKIQEQISFKEIEKHNIHIGTANTSQGNEWDIVFISWVIDNECKHQSLTFACNPERLNVITSRCREKVVNYYSKTNIKECLLSKYLSSIESEN